VGEFMDGVALGFGASGALLDWGACGFHNDSGACGAAIINTLSVGMGGLGAGLARGGQDGLAIGAGVHGLLYGGIGYGLDMNGFVKECEKSRESGE